MKHSHLHTACGHLLYVKTSLFTLSLKLQDWLSLHSLGLMYPHVFNFMRASLILATVESLVVNMCQLHNTLFCLPLAHHSLLLLPFAWLQATKLFYSAHTVLAVEILPWQPHPELVWIWIWWVVYGSLSLFSHMEWIISVEIATELCMAECHDLEGRGWQMQVMKHFVKLFQCISLNEWMNELVTVLLCLNAWQLVRKGIQSAYIWVLCF
jgi:hypothetical protein